MHHIIKLFFDLRQVGRFLQVLMTSLSPPIGYSMHHIIKLFFDLRQVGRFHHVLRTPFLPQKDTLYIT